MRRFLLGITLALVLPASAQAAGRVSAFYYPWYGTATVDGSFQHWAQLGHSPPSNIASSYYPANGLYSSSDKLIVAQQMDEIRQAGIDEIAVSWWGQGSAEDGRLPMVLGAARADGISVAVHLEPYTDRSVATTISDVAYLRGLGIKTFYVYRPFDMPIADWAAAKGALHAGGGLTFYAQTGMVGAASAAGFDGGFTYHILTDGRPMFGRASALGPPPPLPSPPAPPPP